MPTTTLVSRGDVRLEVETWGTGAAPAVLLLAGTSCTRDWWPPGFCEAIAATAATVIRFDQRDTGASTTFPAGSPGYGLVDLVDDALAILDSLELDCVHLVGFSQGGWVAQLLALEHPARVASLTLIATRATGHGPADPDLPEVSDAVLESWAGLAEPDWTDRPAVIDFLVAGERVLAGSSFDEDAVRAMCTAAVARSPRPQSSSNHPLMDPGPRWRERLGDIRVPTAVLHGADDPLFPVGNAYALAAELRGASLRVLPGVGHELPARAWPDVIDAIDHTIRHQTRGTPCT